MNNGNNDKVYPKENEIQNLKRKTIIPVSNPVSKFVSNPASNNNMESPLVLKRIYDNNPKKENNIFRDNIERRSKSRIYLPNYKNFRSIDANSDSNVI